MTNAISTWLYLIGTPARAKKLAVRVDGLKPPPLDPLFGPEPRQCPLTILFNAEVSKRCYANPVFRQALDAWDTGYITASDLKRWCNEVIAGRYTGAVYQL